MADSETIRNRMLAVLTAIFVIAALRASYPVTMPVAATAVIVAAIWPIKPWLDRALPSKISYLGTILVLLFISTGFIGAAYFSVSQIVRAFAQNQDQFYSIYENITNRAAQWGFEGFGGADGYNRLISFGQALLSNVYTIFVYLGFIAILVVLGLPEVPALRNKIREAMTSSDRRELVDIVDEIAGKIRQYVGVTALTSAITGIASALWALTIGLELALVWGILNFLLNFIPIVGNILGIIPASLYAVVQFQSLSMSLIVFLGFAILQIVISNFISPMLQGSRLSLSPAAIIVALAFWSWVWGIAGALLAVPLTVALVITCEHFRGTQWIAKILSSPK